VQPFGDGSKQRLERPLISSGHTYIFTRNATGTTDIDLVVVRGGKNLKRRLLGFVLRTIGRQVLEKAFVSSVKAIEAQNSTARAARQARHGPGTLTVESLCSVNKSDFGLK
jgi:hypothetical protein